MSVSVRTVPVAERSAFGRRLPPTPAVLGGDEAGGGVGGSGSAAVLPPLSKNQKRVSPSHRHWRVLQRLSGVSHVRQLAFSPSTGPASDVYWREDLEEWDRPGGNGNGNGSMGSPNPPLRSSAGGSGSPRNSPGAAAATKRDGRYRSIDPVRATLDALPRAPPLLSNRKHRLPRRSDVGFPNADPGEVQEKQAEIQRETEWEEASPRLIVLVTSDDLGTAVQEDGANGGNNGGGGDDNGADDPRLPASSTKGGGSKGRRNGGGGSSSSRFGSGGGGGGGMAGGLPGMPWAGRHLVEAKERNQRHFSRRGGGTHSADPPAASARCGTTERAGMLAPPLDATYSATVGWRPRPFHDRPPGLAYALVCPLSVAFSVGRVEPLVGSLALYSLQKGKASEDFYFPAGDWQGRLHVDALQPAPTEQGGDGGGSGTVDGVRAEMLRQIWHQRKHKAIFAYDPLMVGDDGEKDLHVVLQVYKVTHLDSMSAYWAGRNNSDDGASPASSSQSSDRKTWRKRMRKHFQKSQTKPDASNRAAGGDEADVLKAILRSNAVFEAYGTQFTSPLCFGITSLFPEGTTSASRSNQWPKGQVQQGMALYASPCYAESQEDFLQRLRKVASLSSDGDTAGKGSDERWPATSFSHLSVVPESEQPVEAERCGESHSVGSTTASSESPAGFSSPSKKRSNVRMFKSPRLIPNKELGGFSHSNVGLSTTSSVRLEDTPLIPGSVTLFASALDVDFLQSMLTTPPELIDKISIKASSSNGDNGGTDTTEEIVLPRILVDASGDSAIMIDPTKSIQGAIGGEPAKRSDLVRVASVRPSEHLDSSEFREVLFLPPRAEKCYDSDFPASDHRSLLNLLYLYPRLLQFKPRNETKAGESSWGVGFKPQSPNQRFTIRTRLIQNFSSTSESGIIESSNMILPNFHNPAAWGGSTLLQSVFTRIPGFGPGSASNKRLPADDASMGIPLRDEYKMKLPMVLDGSYFLQFSLFSLELFDGVDVSAPGPNADASSSTSSGGEECGILLQPLAETTIPLSSSSTRDPISGAKATTVIPNGCHRLRLGDFQLQVETRLVSCIHVSDPAVAAALRDFPFANDDIEGGHSGERLEEMATVASRSGSVSRPFSSKGDSSPDKILFSTIFSAASGSSVAGHFQPLLFLHMCNLIRTSTQTNIEVEPSEAFLIENIHSLLVLVQKVKSFFVSSSNSSGKPRLDLFIKATIDSFDEAFLFAATKKHEPEEDSISEAQVEPYGANTSIDLDRGSEEDDKFDGGAIRRRKKHSVTSDIDLRISRTFSAIEASEIPFSRVAYGATKTDRMRLEAELDADQGRFTNLFDDDETVVTLATTRQAEAHLAEARTTFEMTKKSTPTSAEEVSIHEATTSDDIQNSKLDSDGTPGIDFGSYQRSISELALGKRMKSAAQVMLAPCVTPGLSAVFLCRTSPRNCSPSLENASTDGEQQLNLSASGSPKREEQLQETALRYVHPGSDVGDEDILAEDVDGFLSAYQTTEGLFRSPWNCDTLKFSFPQDWKSSKLPPVARGSFVYESILVLWLRAWYDEVMKSGLKSPREFVMDFEKSDGEKNLFARFHLQMDLLLPLILKSIVLRYRQTVKASKHQKKARVIMDEGHKFVLESYMEVLAVGLIGQAMAELQSQSDEGTLFAALNSCDHVVDFLTGLFAVFHSAHMETLVSKFILTLRACETDHDRSSENGVFEWNEKSLHRVKCSRQLRLRTVEGLAILPNFVALNYPQRFTSSHPSTRSRQSSWTMQHEAANDDELDIGEKKLVPDDGMLPRSGWLAALLANECLSICALSCEAVVAEAMAHIETQDLPSRNTSSKQSSLKIRPTATLRRSDLLMFQSIAIHAITCLHELLLRRHAMDKRFQKESCRERIAALFAQPIFDKSLASVRWLARMESTHKVRSIWLLCFVYILQEAPESLIREAIRTYNDPTDVRIPRFIRLLRLGSSTFQSFIDQERHCMFPSEIDKSISPWLLQESFNTLCATTILVVEESANLMSTAPDEKRKTIHGILDLLLHVLTTPQSSVTHLRAVGGAIQALEKFGAQMFLETTGPHLQHWLRVTLGLMNSTALSVRSTAVDFAVSLLGGVFDLIGNIEDVALVCATVLPEVAAREIALCSVGGLVTSLADAERAVWPLRRSFADLEDANPLDDDRVDPQLAPVLAVFCRTCQAVIDGILIEMRLRHENCDVVGTKLMPEAREKYAFDADEESVFEAANFFAPETAPLQRLRWLGTLKSLHEAKGNWIEAAEALIMSAKTISDSIPHLKDVWRPSRFSLWNDSRRSLWLSTVGEEMGNPEQGNAQVMTFANSFLEPELLVDSIYNSNCGNLPQPTLDKMCSLLTSVAKEAVVFYAREGGADALAYSRLESLLKILMRVLDDHELSIGRVGGRRPDTLLRRQQYITDEAILRGVTASITGDMTKLAEKLMLVVLDEPFSPKPTKAREEKETTVDTKAHFVRLTLSGRKPKRFQESTSLPTFLQWDQPCICRVPNLIFQQASTTSARDADGFETTICKQFGSLILDALLQDLGANSIVFRSGPSNNRAVDNINSDVTYVDIGFVYSNASGLHSGPVDSAMGFDFESRHFRFRKSNDQEGSGMTRYVELSVANSFPCPLSRQQTLLSSEYVSAT